VRTLYCKEHKIPIRPSVIAKTAFVLVMTAILVGCAVGPQFVKPEVAINQKWSVADSSIFITRNTPDTAWWTVFGDSTLNRLIELAYHQNLPLQVAGLRIMESRAKLGVATGQYYPQVQNVTGNVTAVGVSENIADAVGIDRNFWNYQVGFDVAWEADFWGRFRHEVRAEKASLLATVADYDNALVSLTAEVARIYTSIRTFEVLIEQARRNAKLQEEGLQMAESRFRNGATSELDVTQATTLLESTRASIPQYELSLIQSQNALSTLLGQPTGTTQTLLQSSRSIPTASTKIPIIVPAKLLQRRPDVRSAELMAVAQCARIGIAKSDFYPRVLLFGTIGTQSSSGTGVPSTNLFNPGSILYALGPRLVWPILNYGRISNNVRVQDARLQQLLIDYKNTVLKAAQEVEDGLTGYLKAQETVVFTQNATNGAQRSVELALIQYREGAADYQRVLDAQRSLLQEENTLAQTRSSIATNLISLYKALGGGWELRSGQPVVADSTRIEMQHRTNWGNLFSTPKAAANSNVSTPKD